MTTPAPDATDALRDAWGDIQVAQQRVRLAEAALSRSRRRFNELIGGTTNAQR